MSYTKTITLATPITMQVVAASTMLASATFDVTVQSFISWNLRWGRQSVTNLTVPAVAYIEGSTEASPARWMELDRWTSPLGASLCTSTLSGTNSAGEATITVASGGASFAIDDYVLLQDGASNANSEFCRLTSVAATSLGVLDVTLNTHNTSSTVWRGAERYSNVVDVRTFDTCRIVIDNGLNALAGGGMFEVVINSAY